MTSRIQRLAGFFSLLGLGIVIGVFFRDGLMSNSVPAADAQTSAVCRLRDRFWVLLSAGDPLEQQVGVLAGALRDHKGEACGARFLPPAVRAVLEPPDGL